MPKVISPVEIGYKNNRWTVIGPCVIRHNKKYWLCQCDCGTIKYVEQNHLRRGDTKSCGCYNIEKIKERNKLTAKPFNQYYIQDNVAHIILTQGQEALIDVEDIEKIQIYRWYTQSKHHNENTYYAYANSKIKKPSSIKMHRLILDAQPNEVVDHINHNGLDNRKRNLRKCSIMQNSQNHSKLKTNTTGFIGVYKNNSGYVARIRNKRIGTYPTAEAAAKARDLKAKELYGDFAQLNFSKEES